MLRLTGCLLVVFASLVVTVSCSGGTSSNPATPTDSAATGEEVDQESLARFEDILVKRLTGTVKPNSASITVETKEGVICTWAYGLTTDYGIVTTHVDPTMAAPHTIHTVALTGLVPDSLYHYVFVAVGSSGTIYRSADATFQTVPE